MVAAFQFRKNQAFIPLHLPGIIFKRQIHDHISRDITQQSRVEINPVSYLSCCGISEGGKHLFIHSLESQVDGSNLVLGGESVRLQPILANFGEHGIHFGVILSLPGTQKDLRCRLAIRHDSGIGSRSG